VCAFAPSVLGLTGIETADTIDGITSKIKPDIIIMIDSLCAGDASRLGVSFQINNVPIIPGSGIKNSRKKITNKTTTISIGVPLVIYASTFLKSALNHANITPNNIGNKDLQNKLNSLLKQEFNELVTLSEIDYAVKIIGRIIAESINNALEI
jgi:spore protease